MRTEQPNNRTTNQMFLPLKALLTPTPRPVGDLFATDFFATDWRSMRLVQPLYAHIRIKDYNRRLVGNRFATGLRLIGDWSPETRRHVCNQVKPVGKQSATSRRPVGDWSPESFDANGQTYRMLYVMFENTRHRNQSAIGHRLVGDRSPTSRQLVAYRSQQNFSRRLVA